MPLVPEDAAMMGAGNRRSRAHESPPRVPLNEPNLAVFEDADSMSFFPPFSGNYGGGMAGGDIAMLPLPPQPVKAEPLDGLYNPGAAPDVFPPPPSHLAYINEPLSGNDSPMSRSGMSDSIDQFPPSSPPGDLSFMADMADMPEIADVVEPASSGFVLPEHLHMGSSHGLGGGQSGMIKAEFVGFEHQLSPSSADSNSDDMADRSPSPLGGAQARPAKRSRSTPSGRSGSKSKGGGPKKSSAAAAAAAAAAQAKAEAKEQEELEAEFQLDETGLTKDEIKKRRRMLKNRQSASLSRKRKKEYLETLEAKNQTLEDENSKLRARVAALEQHGGDGARVAGNAAATNKLKAKVNALEAENQRLRQQLAAAVPPSSYSMMTPLRTGTALMACFMCFALFTNPLSPNGGRKMESAPSVITPQGYHGRTLQTLRANPPVVRDLLGMEERAPRLAADELGEVSELADAKISSVPPTDSTLDGWIAANEARVISQLNATGTVSPKSVKSTELVRSNGVSNHVEEDAFMLPPPYRLEGGFPASVMQTIRRRADTSYVFCSEVQVLSAVDAVAEGTLPKLSLVMPTGKIRGASSKIVQSENNSTHELVTPVLQVDCDVEGSRVVDTIPSTYSAAAQNAAGTVGSEVDVGSA